LERDEPDTRGLNNATPLFGGGLSNFLSGSSSLLSEGSVAVALIDPGRVGEGDTTPALPGRAVPLVSELFHAPAGEAGVLERDV
jgi:hypothetical protein